jgi:hypothetical protein
MAVRFTCRLVVVRTPSGNLRVRYAHLGSAGAERILTVVGPVMVTPPAGDMTDAEFERWECQLVCDTGSRYVSDLATVDPSYLVEARHTIEDEIPAGSVRWKLYWAQDPSDARTLGVALVNQWNCPIPNFSLSADRRPESPQPESDVPPDWGLGGAGDGPRAFRRLTSGGPDLDPRVGALFASEPSLLPDVRRWAAGLSPEGHWITLRTDGYEFDRIPGARVAAFLGTEPA